MMNCGFAYRLFGVVCALILLPHSFLFAQSPVPTVISSNGGGEAAVVVTSPGSPQVTRVTATGSANNVVEFAIIGGVDAPYFAMDRHSGVLSFKNLTQMNSKDRYEVTVGLTDSAGGTDYQRLSVVTTPVISTIPLPVPGQQCALIPTEKATTYIYNDSLHSFDFFIPSNFTVISLTIGEYTVPPTYISTWHLSSAHTKIHVDVPSTVATHVDAPIVASLASATASCSVPIILDGSRETSVNVPSGGDSSPGAGHLTDSTRPNGNTGEDAVSNVSGTTSTSTPVGTTSDDTTCSSPSILLWVFFLLLQIAGLFGVTRVRSISTENGKTALIVASLGSFLVLAGVWYWLDTCREQVWFLATTTIVSILAIVATFGGSSSSQGNYPMIVKKD